MCHPNHLHYLHKISCLVMRTRVKQMIMYSILSKMKNKILPTCLQRNYRNSLREFSKTLYGVLGAEKVNCVGQFASES